jgi:nicotinamidase-related amidase
MKTLLTVVDMQNGFVNDATRHIVEGITTLIRKAEVEHIEIAFTRFINQPQSGYVKWIRWSRLMSEPEITIIPELSNFAQHVFDKHGYTAFVEEFNLFVEQRGIERILFCGVATDGCVLKSAVDAFERNIEPVVIHDACASHAGVEVHEAGKLLLGRFIGKRQLWTVSDALQRISFET